MTRRSFQEGWDITMSLRHRDSNRALLKVARKGREPDAGLPRWLPTAAELCTVLQKTARRRRGCSQYNGLKRPELSLETL